MSYINQMNYNNLIDILVKYKLLNFAFVDILKKMIVRIYKYILGKNQNISIYY